MTFSQPMRDTSQFVFVVFFEMLEQLHDILGMSSIPVDTLGTGLFWVSGYLVFVPLMIEDVESGGCGCD